MDAVIGYGADVFEPETLSIGGCYALSTRSNYSQSYNNGLRAQYNLNLITAIIKTVYRDEYNRRFNEWMCATRTTGSPASIMRHPEYAEILKLGQYAARFAIDGLKRGERNIHHFIVLNKITGQNPAAHVAGDINAMADEWIAWDAQFD